MSSDCPATRCAGKSARPQTRRRRRRSVILPDLHHVDESAIKQATMIVLRAAATSACHQRIFAQRGERGSVASRHTRYYADAARTKPRRRHATMPAFRPAPRAAAAVINIAIYCSAPWHAIFQIDTPIVRPRESARNTSSDNDG